MSHGDVKTQGGKGNNFPFQFDLLDQLVRLNTAFTAGITVISSEPLESIVTTTPIYSAEPAGQQTRAGLDAAYAAWSAANPNRRVIRQVSALAGDGTVVIYISHTA